MGSLIGYARTQTSLPEHANLAKQKAALVAAGCERVFEESCSGMLPLVDRTVLTQVLERLQSGDMLIVCDIARLSRSLLGLVMVLSDLQQQGVTLRVLDQPQELVDIDQVLDQASRNLDTLKSLDDSRHIQGGLVTTDHATA
jgi:DNA invertase Pin-like site-specific DNA recombinase